MFRLLPLNLAPHGPGYATIGIFVSSTLTRSHYVCVATVSKDPILGNMFAEITPKKLLRLLPTLRLLRSSYPVRFRLHFAIFQSGLRHLALLLLRS